MQELERMHLPMPHLKLLQLMKSKVNFIPRDFIML